MASRVSRGPRKATDLHVHSMSNEATARRLTYTCTALLTRADINMSHSLPCAAPYRGLLRSSLGS